MNFEFFLHVILGVVFVYAISVVTVFLFVSSIAFYSLKRAGNKFKHMKIYFIAILAESLNFPKMIVDIRREVFDSKSQLLDYICIFLVLGILHLIMMNIWSLPNE